MVNVQFIKFFCVSFWLVWLSSCSQPTPSNPTEAMDAVTAISSASPVTTATPIPQTATLLPPSPSSTITLEPPTETSLPSDTPTLSPTSWSTSEAFYDGARVTFINNAGFMITVGDKKILIDALYDNGMVNVSPPPAVLQRIVNALPPFDHVDLLVATHSHVDHFSPKLVSEFLRNDKTAVFISAPDSVEQVNEVSSDLSERLISIDLDIGESSHKTVDGIEVECVYITHGDPSILNIGFIITIDDYTFFHSGDMNVDNMIGDAVGLADLQDYRLPQKAIDLAFLPSYIFTLDQYRPLVVDGIKARYVSPMHYPYKYPPSGIEDEYPNAVIFEDTLMDWVVPPK